MSKRIINILVVSFKKFSIYLSLIVLLCILTGCSNTSTNNIPENINNENNNLISNEPDNSNVEKEITIYYAYDESINLFINKYNKIFDPDITSDMISKKHIAGKDRDDVINVSNDKLEINIYGKGMFGDTMEVYVGYLPNSNYTQEDFKEQFIKYVSLFDDKLTEVDIINHWEKMTADYCSSYEINNIDIWPFVNEGNVLYFKITSEIFF